jgi:guanylate kinase
VKMNGTLFLLAGASGVGKGSLLKGVLGRDPNLRKRVACTTRAMRAGEVDGEDYHFLSKEVFEERVARKLLAEWAEVHGNRYGTLRADLDQLLERGYDVIFDLDVQGVAQLVDVYPDAVPVFVLPPTFDELERRLRLRKTDSNEAIQRRLDNAHREFAEARKFERFVMNDDLDIAISQLSVIIRYHRLTLEHQLHSYPLLREIEALVKGID